MPGSSPREDRDGGVAAVMAPGSPGSPASPASPDPSGPALDGQRDAQRRLSTSSDASSSGLNDSAHKVDATMDYIPTRMTKVSTPKPAANPLQFVKVGPCDLFKSAQETLKKVEEVKKMKKEVRDEAEDWQSNLDNWKCSRRKRVEHIIDRVVEVKKLELEEHERNRKKAKTFSEMMEERTSRGRKMSLLVHKDDDSNDLSDLGIGTSSDKSSVSEDYANDDNHSVDDGDVAVKNHFHDQNGNSKPNSKGGKLTRNGHDDDASTITTISSPEPEEYTYDRAIQGYMNFTETRVKSRPVALKSRKDSKVEEDIAEIERIQSRNHNGSSGDLQSPEKRLNVPKVDITKRKERFERSESADSSEQSKVAPRAAGDLANAKSIRDRVSNLERHKSEENIEKSKQVKRLASDMSVKDRLSLLERQQSSESQTKSSSSSKLNILVSPEDSSAANPPSIKDRLISLKQVTSQEQSFKNCGEISSTSVKKHFMDLEASKEKPQNLSPDRDSSCHDKLANFCDTEVDLNPQGISKPTDNSPVDSTTRFSSPDDDEFYRKRTFHRSLDSLDIDSSSVLSNEPYERVQSLEDLDSCGPSRHYPASASSNENLVLSSHSGDTDREDSGIHTADVSCSVSQADEPVDFSDMNISCGNLNVRNGENYILDSTRSVDYAPPMIVSQLAKMNLMETSVTDKVVPRPEVGPKPFFPNVKESQSLPKRDMLSAALPETDADVSSLLDQALLEEDLKMGVPSVNGSSTGGAKTPDTLKTNQLRPFIAKNNVYPNITSNDVSVLPLAFPLGTPTTAEPPKEKPPPPPVELSDDEEKASHPPNTEHNNNSKSNLGRLDSTKRLKKDIRRKRSDFLGIEGSNDDSYLECELKVAPPPDMTSFLQEERRLEQELYRQMQPALYPESDHGSNQGESRDSGVELDNHLHSHNVHPDYSHEDQPCDNHSRQNSEPFGNASSTSEEDEIIKKEREIIEILEKEEQWRYGTNTVLSPSDHHQVGEKLAAKLRELEQEKMRLEWERAEESRKIAAEHAARQEEQRRMRLKEEQLRQQESIVGRLPADVPFNCDPSDMTLEALREERERLKREQAELDHQRQILAANHVSSRQSWDSSSSSSAHRSLQDVSGSPLVGSHSQLHPPANNTPLNYRLSLPDLQQSDLAVTSMGTHHHRPPPPIPPSKPLAVINQERRDANEQTRQGQIQSSSDSLLLPSEQHHRHNAVGLPSVPVAPSPTSSSGSQQMTRQTLHALSAAPRSKIIATDTWVQAKRKPECQRNNNRDHYQHWLIQEAEHRRITEQQQRNAVSRKSLPSTLSQSQHNQSKPVQAAPPQTPQTWQYQHHHQHSMHQVAHQNQQVLHQHPHNHPPQHVHAPIQPAAPPAPPPRQEKPLPDAIIQTLTQRVQNRASMNENNRRLEHSPARESRSSSQISSNNINNNNLSNININHSHTNGSYAANSQEKMLSVSGKKKCSHCNEELGRGAAMIIESLRLFYHMDCFKCCVCHVQLGDGLMGTDVRVRNHKLHCHNCYSSDDGVKFSCV